MAIYHGFVLDWEDFCITFTHAAIMMDEILLKTNWINAFKKSDINSALR